MGILDNFENALDSEFEFEYSKIKNIEAFWQDIGRPDVTTYELDNENVQA